MKLVSSFRNMQWRPPWLLLRWWERLPRWAPPLAPRSRLWETRFPSNFGKRNQMKKFLQSELGLELSEYAVAAALIAIAVTSAFTALGDAIGVRLNELVTRVGG